MELPAALTRAAREGRLLVLWGTLPYPLAERSPADRAAALSRLAAAGTCGASGCPPALQALTALPPLPILSLDAGDRLERAFAAAGAGLHVVRSSQDLPIPGRHNLLKLAGDLAARRGVVLSRAELRDLQAEPDRRYLLDEVRRAAGHGTGGALLLVGCDPAGEDFRAWWAALAPCLRGLAAFAVGDPAAPWPDGVVCLGADPAAVAAALPPVAEPLPALPGAGGQPARPEAVVSALHTLAGRMEEVYALNELARLSGFLGVLWENVPGDTLYLKAYNLAGHMHRAGRLPELLERLRTERSHVEWSRDLEALGAPGPGERPAG